MDRFLRGLQVAPIFAAVLTSSWVVAYFPAATDMTVPRLDDGYAKSLDEVLR